MNQRRLALLPPRHGTEVVGGAELLIAEMAQGLAQRGWAVEVLTTCARSHYTWENHYPPGTTEEGGVTVRRFPVVKDTSGAVRAQVETMLAQGEHPDLVHQQQWMNDSLRVPELFHYLLDHADDYDAVIAAPYMFWTTFACGQVAPDRTFLMPCLHDEAYARLELFQPLFSGCSGLLFLSEPEAELAEELFELPRHAVVGSGCRVPTTYDADDFRARHGIEGRFLLAGGRREGAKGWGGLMASYARAVQGGLTLPLVTFGIGDIDADPSVADRVIDVGFLSDDELANAFAAADAYLQPSIMESFSRTIMEAWLAGTLVVANAGSAVVSWHCDRSGAGLLYRDEFELEEILHFVEANAKLADEIAAAGRSYVLENYTWPKALDRIEAVLEEWQ